MTGSALTDAFAAHSWATLRLLDVCDGLTAEQLASSVPGTYGSILDTLRHIVGADASYLALLSGDAVPRFSDEEEAALDLAALRDATNRHANVWPTILGPDLDPAALVVRHRDDGSTSSAPRGIRIAQALQHGTDHRSQVCTALTNLGVQPPDIDVWAYGQAHGLLSETPPTVTS
jgi:uncharacterized damage-inducible protein DinB